MTSIPRVRRLRWVLDNKTARLNLGLFMTPPIPTVFDNLTAMTRRQPKAFPFVIPAQAGIQDTTAWTPAYAGVTTHH